MLTPIISLDQGWTVDYFELDPTLYEFMDSFHGLPVSALGEWVFPKRIAEGWGAWIHRCFDLEPIEDRCVDYDLVIDNAPEGAHLMINGREFGAIHSPVTIDVTDCITLEDNRIGFRVLCDSPGAFGTIRLQAVPCKGGG